MADNKNTSLPPGDDSQLFRRALNELYPNQTIDDLTTEELRRVLHLAQRMKAAKLRGEELP